MEVEKGTDSASADKPDFEVQDSTTDTDLYSLTPEFQVVEPDTLAGLIEQAKKFHELESAITKDNFFDRDFYYIISAKWMLRWKLFVGYEHAVQGKDMNKLTGCGNLPAINQDIIDEKNEHKDVTGSTIEMKMGLQQVKDYIFATEEMWSLLAAYPGTAIKRQVRQNHQGKKIVDVYRRKASLILVYNELMKSIERDLIQKLSPIKALISNHMTIEEFQAILHKEVLQNLDKKHHVIFDEKEPFKFWHFEEEERLPVLYNTFYNGCRANPTYNYKLYTNAELVAPETRFSELMEYPNEVFMVEVRESKESWVFYNTKNLLKGSCNACRQQQLLEYLCSCKFAAYCSKRCKQSDKTTHKYRCPNEAQSDQQQTQITLSDKSNMGTTGLRNIGNTCFMNSGLQCLSHVTELSEFFLSGNYQKDINKDNPLGTKGELSVAYAKLIKNLWYGSDSAFTPSNLKRAISKFQPMFSGYNQHDSGQLVTYLLDGLHEDLNRIKKKPYVEKKDYDGSPDHIVAKQAWQSFLLRNQSIIVDLMYGQYRSVLDCPTCKYQSIQFDPYLMCSLPIINVNKKTMQVIYLDQQLYRTPLTISFEKGWQWTMADVYEDVKKQLDLDKDAKMLSYGASYQSCEYLKPTMKANQVRKQHTYRKIYIRKLQEGENPNSDQPLALGNVMCHSYYRDQSYRKNIAPYRFHFINKDITCAQLIDRIYEYHRKLKNYDDLEKDVFSKEEKEVPIKFLYIAKTRYSSCEFCGTKGCEGCIIPYDKDKKFLECFKNGAPQAIEMQLFWRKQGKEIQKIFDDIKEQSEKGQSGGSRGGTTLQDCLKLSNEPEILNEENAWYCPKCKDFVLAKKQMSIYKTPKILILCLKRFKRKQYFTEKYNIMVDFPIENLDLSEYILNYDLPQQYNKPKTQNSKSNKPLYDLTGVVNHFGSTGGGHYTAYAKDTKNNKWYDFDDSMVNELKNKEDVVSENAYILFYVKKSS